MTTDQTHSSSHLCVKSIKWNHQEVAKAFADAKGSDDRQICKKTAEGKNALMWILGPTGQQQKISDDDDDYDQSY